MCSTHRFCYAPLSSLIKEAVEAHLIIFNVRYEAAGTQPLWNQLECVECALGSVMLTCQVSLRNLPQHIKVLLGEPGSLMLR